MSATADELVIWTVYCNPRDYPGKFVVRPFRAWAGEPMPDAEPHFVGDTLEGARASIPTGLVCLGPSPGDDPVIVETWL
jgi:hypothetical protein